jgi:hypothetical protein
MDHLVFDIWGIVGVSMALFCWYKASLHRTDGKRWEISFLPIWKLKSKFDRQGYRYLWVGFILLASAVLPDILYRMFAN